MKHLFWTIVCFFTIGWFIVVMLIVAYRGGIDIKHLLRDLRNKENSESED